MSGADADLRGKLVGNERAKLTATSINGLAIAVFAVGGFAPFIAAPGVATEQHGFLAGALLLLLGVCSLTSGALHWGVDPAFGSLDP